MESPSPNNALYELGCALRTGPREISGLAEPVERFRPREPDRRSHVGASAAATP